MLVILLSLVALILFDVAAWYWGADSRETFESREWRNRVSYWSRDAIMPGR